MNWGALECRIEGFSVPRAQDWSSKVLGLKRRVQGWYFEGQCTLVSIFITPTSQVTTRAVHMSHSLNSLKGVVQGTI